MSVLNVLAALLLLLIPAGALYMMDRKSLKAFALSVARMGLQVLALCLLVWGMIYVNQPWLNMVWLFVASLFSTFVALMRTKAAITRFFLPVGLVQFALTAVFGMYLLYAALPAGNAMDARWFVPVMSLLLGHSTSMQIRGLNAYFSSLKADEQQYEFLRGNGTNHPHAVLPFVRRALLAVIAPTVGNLAVMGAFTMPLLLCGLLIGGFSPLDACGILVVLTIGSVALSVALLLVSIWVSDRKLFDSFGKMMAVVLLFGNVSCLSNKSDKAETAKEEAVTAAFYDSAEAGRARKDQGRIVKYELPAPLKDRPEQILTRRGYSTSYNRKTKTPNWVAWHLTKAHTYGSYQRSAEKFTEDVEADGGSATDNDYYNSRYDRGHMCPAGDNKWDKAAMSQSFLFTNICPQNHGLNKYEWNDLEIQCRDWAREYGAVDIVCGPIFHGGSAGRQATIGRNRVWVPDAFFKVILCRMGKPKAIGFVYRNEGRKQTRQEAVRTVDEIESLTGIDFFTALDDAVENRVEAEARLEDW